MIALKRERTKRMPAKVSIQAKKADKKTQDSRVTEKRLEQKQYKDYQSSCYCGSMNPKTKSHKEGLWGCVTGDEAWV